MNDAKVEEFPGMVRMIVDGHGIQQKVADGHGMQRKEADFSRVSWTPNLARGHLHFIFDEKNCILGKRAPFRTPLAPF